MQCRNNILVMVWMHGILQCLTLQRNPELSLWAYYMLVITSRQLVVKVIITSTLYHWCNLYHDDSPYSKCHWLNILFPQHGRRLSAMECTVMIWKSFLVRSFLGCVVLLVLNRTFRKICIVTGFLLQIRVVFGISHYTFRTPIMYLEISLSI